MELLQLDWRSFEYQTSQLIRLKTHTDWLDEDHIVFQKFIALVPINSNLLPPLSK